MSSWPVVFALVVGARTASADTDFMRFEIDVNGEAPAFAERTFHAAGVLPSGERTQLAASGRELGLAQPWIVGAQTHVLFGLPHDLAVGGLVGFYWGHRDADASAMPFAIDRTVSGVELAPELRASWRRRWLELQGGVAVGLRYAALCTELRDSCSGHVDYAAKATSYELFVQPRITVGWRLATRQSVGVYAGGDVLPSPGIALGVFWASSAR